MKDENILSIEQLQLIKLIENINQKYRQRCNILDKNKALSDNNLKMLKSILPGLIILYKWNQERKEASINLEELIELQLLKYRRLQSMINMKIGKSSSSQSNKDKNLIRLEYLAKIIKFISQEKTIQKKIRDLRVTESDCMEMLEKLNKLSYKINKTCSKEKLNSNNFLSAILTKRLSLESSGVNGGFNYLEDMQLDGVGETSKKSFPNMLDNSSSSKQSEKSSDISTDVETLNKSVQQKLDYRSRVDTRRSHAEKDVESENLLVDENTSSTSTSFSKRGLCEICGCLLCNQSICFKCEDQHTFKSQDKIMAKQNKSNVGLINDGRDTYYDYNTTQSYEKRKKNDEIQTIFIEKTKKRDSLHENDETKSLIREHRPDVENCCCPACLSAGDYAKLKERQKLVNDCSYILSIQDKDGGIVSEGIESEKREMSKCTCNDCEGSMMRLRGGKTNNENVCLCPKCACESCKNKMNTEKPRPPACNCRDTCTCNPCGDTRDIKNIIYIGKCNCPINDCLCDPCGDLSRKKPKCTCPDDCLCNPCGDPSRKKPSHKCTCPDECPCNPCKDPSKIKPTKKCTCSGECTCNPCGDPAKLKPVKICSCPGECSCNPCGDPSKSKPAKICSCPGECSCNPCGDPSKSKPAKICSCSGECSCNPCGDPSKSKPAKICSCPGECSCNPCGDPSKSKPAKICSCPGECSCNPCGDPSKIKPFRICFCSGECTCNPCSDPTKIKPVKICSCPGECKCNPCADPSKNKPHKCNCPDECPCNPCKDPTRNKSARKCSCSGECACNPCADPSKSKPAKKCSCPGECACNPCADPSKTKTAKICSCSGECSCNPCGDPSKTKTVKKCSCPGECACNPCGDPSKSKSAKKCSCPGECTCNPCGDPSRSKSAKKCPCPGECTCSLCADPSRNKPSNKCTCPHECPCDPCIDPSKKKPHKCTCPDKCPCNPCKDPSKIKPPNTCFCPEDDCKCNPCGDPSRNKKCFCPENCLCNPCGDPTRKNSNKCTCTEQCKCSPCGDPTRKSPPNDDSKKSPPNNDSKKSLPNDDSKNSPPTVDSKKCNCEGTCKCNPCKDPTKIPKICHCDENNCTCNPCADPSRQKQESCDCKQCECLICTLKIEGSGSHYASAVSVCNEVSNQAKKVSSCKICGTENICICNLCIPSPVKKIEKVPKCDCTVCHCAPEKQPEHHPEHQPEQHPESITQLKQPQECEHECAMVNKQPCDCPVCECVKKVARPESKPPEPQEWDICVCDIDPRKIDKSKPLGCTCDTCTCDPCTPQKPPYIVECRCKKCACDHCLKFKQKDLNCICSCDSCKCCGHCLFSMGQKRCECDPPPTEGVCEVEGCTCTFCNCDPCEPRAKNMNKCKCPDVCECNACAKTKKKPTIPENCTCKECTCNPCRPRVKNLEKCTCDVCDCHACATSENETPMADTTQKPDSKEPCNNGIDATICICPICICMEEIRKMDDCICDPCECPGSPIGSAVSCKCTLCKCHKKTGTNNDFCCICDDSSPGGKECTYKCICGDHCKCVVCDCKTCTCNPCNPQKKLDEKPKVDCFCGIDCKCTECSGKKSSCQCSPTCYCASCPHNKKEENKKICLCKECACNPCSKKDKCNCEICSCARCEKLMTSEEQVKKEPEPLQTTQHPYCTCNRAENCKCFDCWCKVCNPNLKEKCVCATRKCESDEEYEKTLIESKCNVPTREEPKDSPCDCCACKKKPTTREEPSSLHKENNKKTAKQENICQYPQNTAQKDEFCACGNNCVCKYYYETEKDQDKHKESVKSTECDVQILKEKAVMYETDDENDKEDYLKTVQSGLITLKNYVGYYVDKIKEGITAEQKSFTCTCKVCYCKELYSTNERLETEKADCVCDLCVCDKCVCTSCNCINELLEFDVKSFRFVSMEENAAEMVCTTGPKSTQMQSSCIALRCSANNNEELIQKPFNDANVCGLHASYSCSLTKERTEEFKKIDSHEYGPNERTRRGLNVVYCFSNMGRHSDSNLQRVDSWDYNHERKDDVMILSKNRSDKASYNYSLDRRNYHSTRDNGGTSLTRGSIQMYNVDYSPPSIRLERNVRDHNPVVTGHREIKQSYESIQSSDKTDIVETREIFKNVNMTKIDQRRIVEQSGIPDSQLDIDQYKRNYNQTLSLNEIDRIPEKRQLLAVRKPFEDQNLSKNKTRKYNTQINAKSNVSNHSRHESSNKPKNDSKYKTIPSPRIPEIHQDKRSNYKLNVKLAENENAQFHPERNQNGITKKTKTQKLSDHAPRKSIRSDNSQRMRSIDSYESFVDNEDSFVPRKMQRQNDQYNHQKPPLTQKQAKNRSFKEKIYETYMDRRRIYTPQFVAKSVKRENSKLKDSSKNDDHSPVRLRSGHEHESPVKHSPGNQSLANDLSLMASYDSMEQNEYVQFQNWNDDSDSRLMPSEQHELDIFRETSQNEHESIDSAEDLSSNSVSQHFVEELERESIISEDRNKSLSQKHQFVMQKNLPTNERRTNPFVDENSSRRHKTIGTLNSAIDKIAYSVPSEQYIRIADQNKGLKNIDQNDSPVESITQTKSVYDMVDDDSGKIDTISENKREVEFNNNHHLSPSYTFDHNQVVNRNVKDKAKVIPVDSSYADQLSRNSYPTENDRRQQRSKKLVLSDFEKYYDFRDIHGQNSDQVENLRQHQSRQILRNNVEYDHDNDHKYCEVPKLVNMKGSSQKPRQDSRNRNSLEYDTHHRHQGLEQTEEQFIEQTQEGSLGSDYDSSRNTRSGQTGSDNLSVDFDDSDKKLKHQEESKQEPITALNGRTRIEYFGKVVKNRSATFDTQVLDSNIETNDIDENLGQTKSHKSASDISRRYGLDDESLQSYESEVEKLITDRRDIGSRSTSRRNESRSRPKLIMKDSQYDQTSMRDEQSKNIREYRGVNQINLQGYGLEDDQYKNSRDYRGVDPTNLQGYGSDKENRISNRRDVVSRPVSKRKENRSPSKCIIEDSPFDQTAREKNQDYRFEREKPVNDRRDVASRPASKRNENRSPSKRIIEDSQYDQAIMNNNQNYVSDIENRVTNRRDTASKSVSKRNENRSPSKRIMQDSEYDQAEMEHSQSYWPHKEKRPDNRYPSSRPESKRKENRSPSKRIVEDSEYDQTAMESSQSYWSDKEKRPDNRYPSRPESKRKEYRSPSKRIVEDSEYDQTTIEHSRSYWSDKEKRPDNRYPSSRPEIKRKESRSPSKRIMEEFEYDETAKENNQYSNIDVSNTEYELGETNHQGNESVKENDRRAMGSRSVNKRNDRSPIVDDQYQQMNSKRDISSIPISKRNETHSPQLQLVMEISQTSIGNVPHKEVDIDQLHYNKTHRITVQRSNEVEHRLRAGVKESARSYHGSGRNNEYDDISNYYKSSMSLDRMGIESGHKSYSQESEIGMVYTRNRGLHDSCSESKIYHSEKPETGGIMLENSFYSTSNITYVSIARPRSLPQMDIHFSNRKQGDDEYNDVHFDEYSAKSTNSSEHQYYSTDNFNNRGMSMEAPSNYESEYVVSNELRSLASKSEVASKKSSKHDPPAEKKAKEIAANRKGSLINSSLNLRQNLTPSKTRTTNNLRKDIKIKNSTQAKKVTMSKEKLTSEKSEKEPNKEEDLLNDNPKCDEKKCSPLESTSLENKKMNKKSGEEIGTENVYKIQLKHGLECTCEICICGDCNCRICQCEKGIKDEYLKCQGEKEREIEKSKYCTCYICDCGGCECVKCECDLDKFPDGIPLSKIECPCTNCNCGIACDDGTLLTESKFFMNVQNDLFKIPQNISQNMKLKITNVVLKVNVDIKQAIKNANTEVEDAMQIADKIVEDAVLNLCKMNIQIQGLRNRFRRNFLKSTTAELSDRSFYDLLEASENATNDNNVKKTLDTALQKANKHVKDALSKATNNVNNVVNLANQDFENAIFYILTETANENEDPIEETKHNQENVNGDKNDDSNSFDDNNDEVTNDRATENETNDSNDDRKRNNRKKTNCDCPYPCSCPDCPDQPNQPPPCDCPEPCECVGCPTLNIPAKEPRCRCKVCNCLACGDKKRRRGTEIEKLLCGCIECICDKCPAKPGCECEGECICPVCPHKERKCECPVCLCDDCVAFKQVKQICDCPQCLCEICPKGGGLVPTKAPKLIYNSRCKCPVCLCDNCSSDKLNITCSCPVCICDKCPEMEGKKEFECGCFPSCTCDKCDDKTVKCTIKKNKDEPYKCSCATCYCEKCSDPTKIKTDPCPEDHPKDCTCLKCICTSCLSKKQTITQCKCENCKCDPCSMKAGMLTGCVCQTCACLECQFKTISNIEDCKCKLCQCNAKTLCEKYGSNDQSPTKETTTGESGPKPEFHKCTCERCYCSPCLSKDGHTTECRCPQCTCETCDIKPLETCIEYKAQSADCKCKVCYCNPCKHDTNKDTGLHDELKPECMCPVCMCKPCKAKGAGDRKLDNSNKCKCIQCICSPCTKDGSKTTLKQTDHLPTCLCNPCACNPCRMAKPNICTEPRTEPKYIPECSCPECNCDPCISKPVNPCDKMKIDTTIECYCRTCQCDPCQYPKAEDASNKKKEDACRCVFCRCEPCEIQNVKPTKLDHVNTCQCSVCFCDPCKLKPRFISPVERATKVSPDCKCKLCCCNPCKLKTTDLCHEHMAQLPDCVCTVCSCDPCGAKPKECEKCPECLGMGDCKCSLCFCNPCTKTNPINCNCELCQCTNCLVQLEVMKLQPPATCNCVSCMCKNDEATSSEAIKSPCAKFQSPCPVSCPPITINKWKRKCSCSICYCNPCQPNVPEAKPEIKLIKESEPELKTEPVNQMPGCTCKEPCGCIACPHKFAKAAIDSTNVCNCDHPCICKNCSLRPNKKGNICKCPRPCPCASCKAKGRAGSGNVITDNITHVRGGAGSNITTNVIEDVKPCVCVDPCICSSCPGKNADIMKKCKCPHPCTCEFCPDKRNKAYLCTCSNICTCVSCPAQKTEYACNPLTECICPDPCSCIKCSGKRSPINELNNECTCANPCTCSTCIAKNYKQQVTKTTVYGEPPCTCPIPCKCTVCPGSSGQYFEHLFETCTANPTDKCICQDICCCSKCPTYAETTNTTSIQHLRPKEILTINAKPIKSKQIEIPINNSNEINNQFAADFCMIPETIAKKRAIEENQQPSISYARPCLCTNPCGCASHLPKVDVKCTHSTFRSTNSKLSICAQKVNTAPKSCNCPNICLCASCTEKDQERPEKDTSCPTKISNISRLSENRLNMKNLHSDKKSISEIPKNCGCIGTCECFNYSNQEKVSKYSGNVYDDVLLPTENVCFQITDTRKLTDESLLIKWSPADLPCLSGYEIDVNGVLSHRVRNKHRCIAVLFNICFQKPVNISVFAISNNNRMNPPAITTFCLS